VRNEIEGWPDALAHDTKEAAVEVGSTVAERLKTDHVIHNIDGTIAQQTSYGHNLPRDNPVNPTPAGSHGPHLEVQRCSLRGLRESSSSSAARRPRAAASHGFFLRHESDRSLTHDL